MNRKASSYLPPGLPTPVVDPDGLSAPYWAGLREGRLLMQRCAHCQTWQFGPEWLCHRCHAFDPPWVEVEPRHLQLGACLASLARSPPATRSVCGRAGGIAGCRRRADGRQFAGRSHASGGDRRGGRRRLRASSGFRSAIFLAAMADALSPAPGMVIRGRRAVFAGKMVSGRCQAKVMQRTPTMTGFRASRATIAEARGAVEGATPDSL